MKYLKIPFVISLLFFTCFASAQQTNLPIVLITSSTAINDMNQVQANLSIINNVSGINLPTDAPAYTGNIGIKFRGSSTHPKRSYNVETWTAVNTVSLDTALLGMPRENDWVLLANYTDRSLMRDLLGFHIWQSMGNYAPRMKLVELILNNVYMGVYLFGEKIKRDINRVDIANLKLTDASGIELTGGYIFKIDNSNADYWASLIAPPYATNSQDIKFHYEEPQDNTITPVQQAYIKSYVDSFEAELQSINYQDTLLGWRAHAGQNSFEDYMLFNEVVKNADAYRIATYLYKDKGKKLRAGPPWDLELSLYNTANCNASLDAGWAYQYGQSCGNSAFLPPFWWEKLASDTLFMRNLKCKYSLARQSFLDTTHLYHFIDSIASYLNAQQAQTRNFTQWPIFGVPIVNEPTPMAANYDSEVANLKGYIKRRLQFLDGQWLVSGCTLGVHNLNQEDAIITLHPNPASGQVSISIQLSKAVNQLRISVRDMMGREVMLLEKGRQGAGIHRFDTDITSLVPGVYAVWISTEKGNARAVKLVKE